MKKNLIFFNLLISIISLLSLGVLSSCKDNNASITGHRFGDFVPELEPTCTEEGHIGYKQCLDCMKYFDESGNEISDIIIKAKGHNFGEWVVTKKVDDTSNGEKQRTCSVCNYVETATIKLERYSITYDLNGGIAMSDNPTSYLSTDEGIFISNAFKQGFVFSGWSINGEEPITNYTIEYGTEGDLVFKAVFENDNTTIYNGQTIDMVPNVVRNYLESEDKAKYLYEYQNNYSIARNPQALKITWTNSFNTENFTLKMFSNKEMTEEIFSENVYGNSYNFFNPIPGKTYYYKVIDENDNLVKMDYFKIKEGLRTINCGIITNMRDMGGYNTPNGMIPYGLIYRSPEIAEVTKKGKSILVDQLGIKTEIDLRVGSTTPTIDESIQKYVLGIVQWDCIFPGMETTHKYSSVYTDNIAQIFRLFANKENYPIVFHCTSGADRTGTIAFLLNGLLGVSYEDLASDFEITSFYMGKRWRSDIQVNNGVYSFTDDGVMQDDSDNLVSFNKAYNYIMETYGGEKGTLSEAIENYLKSVAKITDNEIASIKHILFSTSEHAYGDWMVTEQASCQKEGIETRYCGCGESETRVIPISGHVYGEWQVVKEPSVGEAGLKERYCECGDRQTEVIPPLLQNKYDIGGNEKFDLVVNTPGINKYAAVKMTDKSSLPEGYEGEVYSNSSDNLISIGVGFNTEYKIEDLLSIKIRLCIQADSDLPKGNIRLYDDKECEIRVDNSFKTLAGVYNEWVEIDILPLIKSYSDFTTDGILHKVCLVVRTGATATVSFDSVTVTAYDLSAIN